MPYSPCPDHTGGQKSCDCPLFLSGLKTRQDDPLVFCIERSKIELKSCNLVQMLLDKVMPEIRNINTLAFETNVKILG